METKEFIYRVEFKEPPFAGVECRAFNFRSLAAIFEMFTNDQVGVALKTLWNHKVSNGIPFVTSKAVIVREPLYRKKHTQERTGAPDSSNTPEKV